MLKRRLFLPILIFCLFGIRAGATSDSLQVASDPKSQAEFERLVREARRYDCAHVTPDQVDRQKAVDLYNQALQKDPGNPRSVDVLLRIGQLYICNFSPDRGETDEPEKALAAFKKIFEQREKNKREKYCQTELRALIFLGEAYGATRQSDRAIQAYTSFFSIKPEQLEFAPHEWIEIPEKDREKAMENLRTTEYARFKSIFENHVRMAVGPLNNPIYYARLEELQKQYPQADLLPKEKPGPPPSRTVP
jgi:tetratricopeptide (TPR) repeat protein